MKTIELSEETVSHLSAQANVAATICCSEATSQKMRNEAEEFLAWYLKIRPLDYVKQERKARGRKRNQPK